MKKSKILSFSMAILLVASVLLSPGTINALGKEVKTVKVIIHYNRPDNKYDSWNVWAWFVNLAGKAYEFNKEDSFGRVAEFTIENPNNDKKIGFIIRKGEWQAKDVESDRFADINNGVAEFWLLSGESTVYYSESQAKGAVVPKIKGATIEDLNAAVLKTNIPFQLSGKGDEGITIKTGSSTLDIVSVENADKIGGNNTDTVLIKTKQNFDIGKTYKLTKKGYSGEVVLALGDGFFTSNNFNDKFAYTGNDLGAIYTKGKTSFRVWAPFAEKMSLIIYKSGDISDKQKGKKYAMKKDVKGTWTLTINSNLNGTFYTYSVKNPGRNEQETGDPYAKAVGINGDRSAVVDLKAASPQGWSSDMKPAFGNATDAVVYELHLRDLAMDKNSGIKNKGKYIEFTENTPNSSDGTTRGINHLKELGVTHIHLLPVFDYATIDEKTLNKNEFNWGYDPKNYNVPEGSYSTNPAKPEVRIKEFKEMVQSLHKNGLRIVMDVVYNHTNDNITSKFNVLVPGYYYRMNADGSFKNGSGCGSETASERDMMRKYIVDSVKYWAKEYHVDGFRFDLMGLHDVDTMNAVKAELASIDKSIIVYGEGWDMGSLDRDQRAIQPHAEQMGGIGFFNDNIRDNIKGPWNDKTGHGFVDGKQNLELEIMQGAAGSIKYNDIVKDYNMEPGQSINYVDAHDNNTLWDKLLAANPSSSEADLIKMDTLSNSIVLTSQGVPFMQAGADFLRTKQGDENSYKSPDSINALDWSRKSKYISVFNYYKGLIELRKAHPAFRMPDTDMIKGNMAFIDSPRKTVAFLLKNNANKDSWKNIFVGYNSNTSSVNIGVPAANWNIVVKDDKAGVKTLESFNGSSITVPPLSTVAMYTNDNIEVKDLFAGKKVVKAAVNSNKLNAGGKEITADTAISAQGDTIYLPLSSVAKAIGAATAADGNGKISIINGADVISAGVDKVTLNGISMDIRNRVKISGNTLLVTSDFAEELLKVKVFADYKRYNSDTSRADDNAPDIYIVY